MLGCSCPDSNSDTVFPLLERGTPIPRRQLLTGLQRLNTSLPGAGNSNWNSGMRGVYSWRHTTKRGSPDSTPPISSSSTIIRSPREEPCEDSICQVRHAQAKLCRVTVGQALDVAVDFWQDSPAFGKWTNVLLTAEKMNQIYIPAGCSHGFATLRNTVGFLYKYSDFYDFNYEHGVMWNDPSVGIPWGLRIPL
jgi:hypothetical protein